MSYVPSQDQVMAQLRIWIPVAATIATAYGVTQGDVTSYTNLALTAVGPISYVIVGTWSAIANTRQSIMKAASKSAGPGIPAPKIELPKEEAALADKLPANVTSVK